METENIPEGERGVRAMLLPREVSEAMDAEQEARDQARRQRQE